MSKIELKIAGDILAKYGLSYKHILPLQSGYRNRVYPVVLEDGTKINLILYKTEPGILKKIENANKIGNFLAEHGYPARQNADLRTVSLKTSQITKYCALYNYLPGETIPWEAYTMQHLKLLGASMSNMHAMLIKFTDDLPSVADECLMLNRRMRKYFADPYISAAIRAKLGLRITIKFNAFISTLLTCSELPDQQALHMDFVRGNILFNDDSEGMPAVSGVIDFEKTAYGHPVFDIARTLAFLLVDCRFKTEPKIRKYFLASGYNKRGAVRYSPVLIYGRDLLEELINFFLIHDLYKFLRHNPYENLSLNEHFIRTRDLLLSRHVLSL